MNTEIAGMGLYCAAIIMAMARCGLPDRRTYAGGAAVESVPLRIGHQEDAASPATQRTSRNTEIAGMGRAFRASANMEATSPVPSRRTYAGGVAYIGLPLVSGRTFHAVPPSAKIDEAEMKRIPLAGGDEFDVLAGHRHRYCYTQRPGVCKNVKRGYARRFRRAARLLLRLDMDMF